MVAAPHTRRDTAGAERLKVLIVVFRVGDSEALQGHDSGCISLGLNREKGEARFTSESLKRLRRRFNTPERDS